MLKIFSFASSYVLLHLGVCLRQLLWCPLLCSVITGPETLSIIAITSCSNQLIPQVIIPLFSLFQGVGSAFADTGGLAMIADR
jgi:hypothetical protein